MSGAENGREHIRHEVCVCGGSNTIFNGVSAWLLMKGGGSLYWSGDHSFAGDVVATAFLLPLIVAFIVIPLQRSKLSKGTLQPINLGPSSGRSLPRQHSKKRIAIWPDRHLDHRPSNPYWTLPIWCPNY